MAYRDSSVWLPVTKFAPNVFEVTAPLRELPKKDIVCHEQSQSDIRKILIETSNTVILNFQLVDACKSGLGTALIQAGSPIVYTSLSLTETEKKEVLEVVL